MQMPHVAGTEFVQAAFLVDPVDNTRETPESDSYPSAAKALKLHDRPVGMCGASVIGSCNPNGSNWQVHRLASSGIASSLACTVLHSCNLLDWQT